MLLKYTQARTWLKSCLVHLPNATPSERQRVVDSVSNDGELSEDENFPRYGVSLESRQTPVESHGVAHGHLMRLLEFKKAEPTIGLT